MKKVAVIGAGESGIGAALLAKSRGIEVFVSDFGSIDDKYKKELLDNDIHFEEGGHDIERLLSTDLVIKSPGVPNHASVIGRLKESGVKIISEIEFGFLFYEGFTLAVTGSNGKTTASGLLYHLLYSAGKQVALGGNYGKSFARILAEGSPEMIVLEVSSFQLDDIEHFRPHVAILLNITPDHLDRYDHSMQKYAHAKFRITENQTPDDYFIYNGDDPVIIEELKSYEVKAHQLAITRSDYINGIPSKDGSGNFELTIKGTHNLLNAATVVEACRVTGLSEQEIARGLKTFVNLPHRLESCGMISGVEFINDSKATNVDAVYYALEAMEKPVVWIAGGTDKGNDYEVLLPFVEEKVNALICLGVDNSKLKTFFRGHIQAIVETKQASEAVELGLKLAEAGDVVLLSPACASFDLFKNYMDRGDQFKAAVSELARRVNEDKK
ncbi:MAG: UDP-N-acetylmuramoyl-L-alanine--D-glutamate ligase [Saprospiraceae bacterium]|nr:MAG: UDP-N-acetylmuramoylalanine--D-glutamate ligase [Bacteroidetes bacterium OLB9]MCO6463479.1 UDP-N-acetylmuramoyl-L-alanine--D-glutamate ligase [Saprospiraceae bacterium]MCZ2338549.1 UDP-N-acetylmuramoyl-L-alanine--D-glutamate ligase [Chitinophagales bacterium]